MKPFSDKDKRQILEDIVLKGYAYVPVPVQWQYGVTVLKPSSIVTITTNEEWESHE